MNCLICARELETAFERTPYGATVFEARGNYGSGLWDPVPFDTVGPRLQVYICDGCLYAQAARVTVVRRLVREEVTEQPFLEYQENS